MRAKLSGNWWERALWYLEKVGEICLLLEALSEEVLCILMFFNKIKVLQVPAWTSQPQTVVETWWSSGEQGIEHQIQHSQSFQSAAPFSANLNSTGRLNCPISFFTSVSPRQMMAGIEIQSPFVDATEEPVYFFLAVEIRFQKINRFSSHFSFCLSSWLTTRAFIERFNHSAHRNGARRKYGVESILV